MVYLSNDFSNRIYTNFPLGAPNNVTEDYHREPLVYCKKRFHTLNLEKLM